MGFSYGWHNATLDFMDSMWISQAGKGAAQNILDKGAATIQTAANIANALTEIASGGNLYQGSNQKLGEDIIGGIITLPDVSRQMLHEFANINPGDPYKLGYTAVDAALIVAAYKQTGSWSSAYQRAYNALSAEGRLTTVAEMSRLRGASYADPSLPYVPKPGTGSAIAANNPFAYRLKYSDSWQSASLKDAVNKFVGPNPTVEITQNGKRIYSNPSTGVQVVEDVHGGYFRIEDTNIRGKRSYLDMDGKIPNNMINESGKQTGRSPGEYNSVTHFKNRDK